VKILKKNRSDSRDRGGVLETLYPSTTIVNNKDLELKKDVGVQITKRSEDAH